MEEKIYFYRKPCNPDFIQSSTEKAIIPVRSKNKFIAQNLVLENGLWHEAEEIPSETENAIPEEFVERAVEPKSFVLKDRYFFGKNGRDVAIEDFSPQEMRDFLVWRKEKERWQLNASYFRDANGCKKDYVSAQLALDREKFRLTLTFLKFASVKNSDIPSLVSINLSFDIKNGIFETFSEIENAFGSELPEKPEFENHVAKDLKVFSSKCPTLFFSVAIVFLTNLEQDGLPKSVLVFAYQKFCELACDFTKVSLSFDSLKGKSYLYAMLLLTMLPYEPTLYLVLTDKELMEMKFRFHFKRTDSQVFNHFCKKAHINPYRNLRKCFAEDPHVLLVYMRLRDAGFRDLNLYNRVFENKDNILLIEKLPREALVFFSRYSIKRRGEIATMNTLLKNSNNEDFFVEDGLDMFYKYFRYIPKELKKDILADGFTQFNHDALANLSYRIKNKKIVFKYKEEQKNLEDDIAGYSFRLPATSYEMCEIGTSLHNCVASYAESVQEKDCTIVYAKKDGEYKICIEVMGNKVVQERIDRNAKPCEEEAKILSIWHERHGLVR